jgi:hypothetical protein
LKRIAELKASVLKSEALDLGEELAETIEEAKKAKPPNKPSNWTAPPQ